MRYHIVSNSTDQKTIGKKYPQCKGMPSGMGLTSGWFDQPNSMTKLTNDEFPDFEPELIFELEEKAVLTDIVSPSNISAKGLLINQKVKDILSQFRMAEHKYYQATLLAKGVKINYYWLHFVKKDLAGVDLKESLFYKSEFGFDKGAYININTYDDALKIIRKESCFIMPEKLVLNCEKNTQVFYLPLTNRIIVDDDVVAVMKEKDLKGITFNFIH